MSRKSKFLSLVLRHKPEEIEIVLDRAGWVAIDLLIRQMRRAGRPITRNELEAIVAENDKKRFTISEDGRRIRAAQGHSVPVDLNLEPTDPPSILYHGTARANLDAIFSEGLKPGARRHVHLSPDPETALAVGRRHGRPVVLSVNTAAMHDDGIVFFRADNGVWLTGAVAPKYLGFAEADRT